MRPVRNIDRIREASPHELAEMLDRWIVRCSGECPGINRCRGGMSCRQALYTWLIGEEEEHEESGGA